LYIALFLYGVAVREGSLNELEARQMVRVLKVSSKPIRLKMIASLDSKPKNVCSLTKELGLPYLLAHAPEKASMK
jgi:hypothetical protein